MRAVRARVDRDVEGFSAPEIAEALELKLNTVYSRLRRAREDFERALARLRAREERMR
jgi:RNA polymerase sigma-70 factor (ECF subfamily)